MRHDLLGHVGELLRAAEHRSTLRLPGNFQSGTLCSPRPRSGSGCASKYSADPLVQLEEPQGVPSSRAHVVVVRLPGFRRVRGHRQDRVHHEVHGDDVDDPLGDPGELGDLPEPVGPDDRVGHLEPVDPPGERVGVGRFDDARPHDAQREVGLGGQLLDRALAHRLRERVDVGPTERASALRPYSTRRLVTHFLRRSSASPATVDGPGARVLLARSGEEGVQHLGFARLHLDVVTRLERELQLQAIVHPVVERALGDHALLHARDVGGGHVHERGCRTAGDHASVQVHRAQ